MLITTITFIFLARSHPLLMGVLLIILRILYGYDISFKTELPWLSYILVIIFVRGLIVIILYISRISSNEDIKINIKILISSLFIIPFLPLLRQKLNKNIININFFNQNNIINILYKIYDKILINITIIIILYLLIVLIVTIKIITIKKIPLKMKK